MLRTLALAAAVGAWVALLTLPLNVRVLKLGQDQASFDARLLTSAWIGLLVAATFVLLALLRQARSSPAGLAASVRAARVSDGVRDLLTGTRRRSLAVSIVLLAAAAAVPLVMRDYYVFVGIGTLIYVGLALGLNLVVGQAGLLVLGYAGFYAAGAYTYGILNRESGAVLQLLHLPASWSAYTFWLALPAGGLVAMLFGLLLGAPTLRLRGDYLAIVTLGFGEMIRIVLITADRLTGGPNGITEIARPQLLGRSADDRALYWMALALVAATIGVSMRLNDSRIGRAWMAMREDEKAARAMGIDITRMRLLAFSLAALAAGLFGVLFAARQSSITPESFSFIESVTILAMVILGGMGSIPGVVFGAVVLSVLPEVLRPVAQYRMIVLAGLMILMMTFRPQGLFPNARRKLELEVEKGAS